MAKGTFLQEPGSGVSAIVDGARVSVGTLEWLERQGVTDTGATSGSSATAAGTLEGLVSEVVSGSGKFTAPLVNPKAMGLGSSHTRVFVGVDGKLVGSIDVQV